MHQLTDVPARTVGLGDRGRLAAGYKADINLIDLDRLSVAAPHPVHNLPGGGRRLEQKAEGYRATIVSGEVTYREAPSRARCRPWSAALVAGAATSE